MSELSRKRSKTMDRPSGDTSKRLALTLNPCRAAQRIRLYIRKRRHRGIARERRQQSPVSPPQIHGFLFRLAIQKGVDKTGREAVSAPHPIVHMKLARRRLKRLAVDPG